MRMFVLGLVLALACSAGVQAKAPTQGYSRAAQRVLAQARAASGGAGWNYLRGWHETGRQGGLAYDAWFDPLRYGLRIETREPSGLAVQGFNGLGAWKISPAGAVTGSGDLAVTAPARTEAFFRVYGFFYPGRLDARGDFLGVRQAGGRSFDVVEVKPWSGNARQLWFDRRTHLLGRMVERPGGRPVVTDFSDYRKVGPLMLAFRFTVEGAGETQTRQIESLVFTPADRAMFSLPRS